MQLLEQAISERGRVKDGEVLKVDAFLNHQMDVALINELGKEFYRRFGDRGVTKILTIEASGIGILTSQVTSFTHQRNYDIIVSARFLSPDDRVLLIDDFLAKGSAMLGLISLVRQSGATIVGAGICIEKGFDVGGKAIRDLGIEVQSLAVIQEMQEGHIVFAPDPYEG